MGTRSLDRVARAFGRTSGTGLRGRNKESAVLSDLAKSSTGTGSSGH